jgi:hypothetical protein
MLHFCAWREDFRSLSMCGSVGEQSAFRFAIWVAGEAGFVHFVVKEYFD